MQTSRGKINDRQALRNALEKVLDRDIPDNEAEASALLDDILKVLDDYSEQKHQVWFMEGWNAALTPGKEVQDKIAQLRTITKQEVEGGIDG